MTGDDKVRYLDPVDITDTSAMTNAHAVRVTVSQPFPTPLIPFFASSGRVMTTSATAEQAALGSLYVGSTQIGRAHVWTPVTNAHLVCRLLLDKKKITTT